MRLSDSVPSDPFNNDAQAILEDENFSLSKSRLNKDNEGSAKRGAWSDSKIGKVFTLRAHNAFVSAVDAFVNRPNEQGRRHNRAAELLKKTGLEIEMISFLFVKSVFNMLYQARHRRLKRVSFCIRAADLVHTEWRIRHFGSDVERAALLDKLKKDMDRRTYPKEWRVRTLRMYFDAEQIDWNGWSQREKLAVGYALMVLFRDSTGLITCKKNERYVEPAEELVDRIEEALEKSVLDFTLYWPMVARPIPWSEDRNLFRGGYLNKSSVRRYPIIKGAKRRDVDRMLHMDWSRILPAINALQETPWRVNRRMTEVLDWVYNDLGDGRCDLPPADKLPLPPKPLGYGEDEEVTKEHNHACFLIHDRNRQMISKRIAVLFTLHLADKFKAFPRIYFPHNMDVRGRAYPLPAFLTPQGPDYAKGLLEFANAEPIEDLEQAAWLAVAGANAWGNDKIALQDRADWVVDNEYWIVECGNDPKGNTKWMKADEPFQFLRFCMEWAGFCQANAEGVPFYSHMPVAVDATNSGLQHYSAMLRDEVGGRSVNLIPGLPRQDIYQDVADKVQEDLYADDDWLKWGIDRKTTKRQVMVVPYAGKFSSCLAYTKEAFYDRIHAGEERPWPAEEDHERLVDLAKMIWEAIDQVVIGGKIAMRWLSGVASEWSSWANEQDDLTSYDKRMTWTTPDGLEVVQWRNKSKRKRVSSFLEGKVSLSYFEEGTDLNTREMSLSMPPNFVHSLDATHMRMSIMKAKEVGIRDFAMVHDSFGVHARFMPRFLEHAVKPAFVDMYEENDPLEELAEGLPFNVSPPPEKGTLDLSGVLDSEFFFS